MINIWPLLSYLYNRTVTSLKASIYYIEFNIYRVLRHTAKIKYYSNEVIQTFHKEEYSLNLYTFIIILLSTTSLFYLRDISFGKYIKSCLSKNTYWFPETFLPNVTAHQINFLHTYVEFLSFLRKFLYCISTSTLKD